MEGGKGPDEGGALKGMYGSGRERGRGREAGFPLHLLPALPAAPPPPSPPHRRPRGDTEGGAGPDNPRRPAHAAADPRPEPRSHTPREAPPTPHPSRDAPHGKPHRRGPPRDPPALAPRPPEPTAPARDKLHPARGPPGRPRPNPPPPPTPKQAAPPNAPSAHTPDPGPPPRPACDRTPAHPRTAGQDAQPGPPPASPRHPRGRTAPAPPPGPPSEPERRQPTHPRPKDKTAPDLKGATPAPDTARPIGHRAAPPTSGSHPSPNASPPGLRHRPRQSQNGPPPPRPPPAPPIIRLPATLACRRRTTPHIRTRPHPARARGPRRGPTPKPKVQFPFPNTVNRHPLPFAHHGRPSLSDSALNHPLAGDPHCQSHPPSPKPPRGPKSVIIQRLDDSSQLLGRAKAQEAELDDYMLVPADLLTIVQEKTEQPSYLQNRLDAMKDTSVSTAASASLVDSTYTDMHVESRMAQMKQAEAELEESQEREKREGKAQKGFVFIMEQFDKMMQAASTIQGAYRKWKSKVGTRLMKSKPREGREDVVNEFQRLSQTLGVTSGPNLPKLTDKEYNQMIYGKDWLPPEEQEQRDEEAAVAAEVAATEAEAARLSKQPSIRLEDMTDPMEKIKRAMRGFIGLEKAVTGPNPVTSVTLHHLLFRDGLDMVESFAAAAQGNGEVSKLLQKNGNEEVSKLLQKNGNGEVSKVLQKNVSMITRNRIVEEVKILARESKAAEEEEERLELEAKSLLCLQRQGHAVDENAESLELENRARGSRQSSNVITSKKLQDEEVDTALNKHAFLKRGSKLQAIKQMQQHMGGKLASWLLQYDKNINPLTFSNRRSSSNQSRDLAPPSPDLDPDLWLPIPGKSKAKGSTSKAVWRGRGLGLFGVINMNPNGDLANVLTRTSVSVSGGLTEPPCSQPGGPSGTSWSPMRSRGGAVSRSTPDLRAAQQQQQLSRFLEVEAASMECIVQRSYGGTGDPPDKLRPHSNPLRQWIRNTQLNHSKMWTDFHGRTDNIRQPAPPVNIPPALGLNLAFNPIQGLRYSASTTAQLPVVHRGLASVPGLAPVPTLDQAWFQGVEDRQPGSPRNPKFEEPASLAPHATPELRTASLAPHATPELRTAQPGSPCNPRVRTASLAPHATPELRTASTGSPCNPRVEDRQPGSPRNPRVEHRQPGSQLNPSSRARAPLAMHSRGQAQQVQLQLGLTEPAGVLLPGDLIQAIGDSGHRERAYSGPPAYARHEPIQAIGDGGHRERAYSGPLAYARHEDENRQDEVQGRMGMMEEDRQDEVLGRMGMMDEDRQDDVGPTLHADLSGGVGLEANLSMGSLTPADTPWT
eukprot:gene19818-26503_t